MGEVLKLESFRAVVSKESYEKLLAYAKENRLGLNAALERAIARLERD